MSWFKSATLFLGSMFVASSALAGSGDISAVVTELAPNVSFGNSAKGFAPYVGYSVQLSNNSTNTINNIYFKGTTAAALGNPGTFAFVTGAGAPTCTATTTATLNDSVSCFIGQLKSGGTSPVFFVYFTAPDQPDSTTLSTTLAFSGVSQFAEGTNDPNSQPPNSTTPWTTGIVYLGTTSPDTIKSAVPKVQNNLRFFTAQNPSGQLNDQITTNVSVPSLNAQISVLDYAQVRIKELSFYDLDCENAKNFKRCYTTQLDIQKDVSDPASQRLEFPSTGPYILTEVRIGPEAILPGFKASSVKIFYDSTLIGLCSNGYSLPCAESIDYYKTKGQAPSPDLIGVFRAIIRNDHNGTLKLF